MNLSISNIAWFNEEDNDVLELLKENGFTGIDVAPKRLIEDFLNASDNDIKAVREKIEEYGISIIGMQALLYGKPELKVFESKENRADTMKYLKKVIDYASKLGCKRLIFGSPKNRRIGEMDYDKAEQIAEQFFRELGAYSLKKGICFCLEPNPTEYGADFMTNTYDAIKFVKKVNNEGFKLNVDLGTIMINDENTEEIIKSSIGVMKHFHISQPFLMQIADKPEVHRKLAKILREYNYNGFVAIEMKNGITTPNVSAVKKAIEFVADIYGGELNE